MPPVEVTTVVDIEPPSKGSPSIPPAPSIIKSSSVIKTSGMDLITGKSVLETELSTTEISVDSSRRPSNTSSSSGFSTSSNCAVDQCPNPNCPAIIPVTVTSENNTQPDISPIVSDSDSGIMSSLSPSEVR